MIQLYMALNPTASRAPIRHPLSVCCLLLDTLMEHRRQFLSPIFESVVFMAHTPKRINSIQSLKTEVLGVFVLF